MKRYSLIAASMAACLGIMPALAQDTPETKVNTEAKEGASCEGGQCKMGAKGKHKMGRRGGRMGGLKAILTEDQKAQVEEILKASREKSQPLFEKMKALRTAKAEGKDAEAAKAEFQSIREQLRAERKATHEKIMALLTPEQKAKLEAGRGGATEGKTAQ